MKSISLPPPPLISYLFPPIPPMGILPIACSIPPLPLPNVESASDSGRSPLSELIPPLQTKLKRLFTDAPFGEGARG